MNSTKKNKPIVYLICGQVGSGKTTFAKKLEKETNAIRITPDEWMLKLYPDMPKKEDFDNFYYKCCDVAWSVACEIVKRGGDVILDFSFWKRKERVKFRNLAINSGALVELFYIKCDDKEILKRLRKRNLEQPEGSIRITDDMFDFFSPGFEPPEEDEAFTLIKND